ncbi:helix-turn-helix domain-containing protein [Streptomyces sp. NPDC008150]|uniref:PucR family transcriptional regulator n=1 Tax=Streptomyces sp. NPDC008150 TaxID=3364816 RepID=UPI0036EFF8FD
MAGRQDGTVTDAARTGGRARWPEELLDHLRPAGRDIGRITAWLADTVRGTVCLRDGTGTRLAGSALDLDEELAADITGGRLGSAAVETAGRHVRLVAVARADHLPSALLAVSRTEPFDRGTADVVAHTAAVLELLLRARDTAAAGDRLQRAASDLRLAILQLLMVEDVVSARRVAAGLWPGLLDTETACVYVVEGGPEQRDALAAECRAVLAGRALVVPCPALDAHVIIVAPVAAAGDELRALVARHPGTFVGGSARHGLSGTATAYGQAVSALAVAHFRPDGAAAYAERTRPERLMAPEALRSWTAALLRPLDELPHHTRAELLATTRLGLEFTAVNAAKILGVSRNTVRARMERLAGLLGTDLSDLRARAVVHLALNSQEGLGETGAGPGRTGRTAPPAVLGDLLSAAAVRTWARHLLGRLPTDTRDLRTTVRAWIVDGGNAERAAQTLGFHAQTVREHVRCAEPVLERQLLAGGSDLYEVVLAHLALGELEAPPPHGANRGVPDSPVHG